MDIKNKFPKDTRFLVTGGAGFIGSNLCELLIEAGYHTRCMDNLSTGKLENIQHLMACNNFEFINEDITNVSSCESAAEGVDYIFHQAAWGSIPRSIRMPVEYGENNIQGTLNMLEAAKKNQVKKFVYASSSSVYGDSQTLPKKEGEEGEVISPYALTKKVNELHGKLYSDIYDLPTVGLRYFNVFGRRQNPNGQYAAVIPKFIELMQQNDPLKIYGDGKQSRDFTYIDNVLQANIKAALSSDKTNGKAYNIACGEVINLNNLVAIMSKIFNKEAQVNYTEKRKGDIVNSYASIEKSVEALNYSPTIKLEEGLAETIKWYMSQSVEILSAGSK
ncbi:SDR family oxidoreductase [Enterococcus villorum]|uniref:Epimerase n=2 Tax=Enterococcus villorum TaxID=112904 RepID=A0A511J3C7_9ENTE|nr:SDR family oxidoreductase [Enterococcus villorum]EOH91990.1 hypothetical protein UAO_00661 [Enterococcus villorum ATCC 700913]EOW76706.1 hypothetical protein I591_02014 [Enterococcus villorum ATCC 700913]GEL92512.1 epimerase [Enterococcus villorum]